MNVFVAATRQNDGKTMVSLGLFSAFQKRFSEVAYIKPVGQQYKIVNEKKIDKDAVLMHSVYNLPDDLSDMSPIAVPRGFTTDYINKGKREELEDLILNAYNTLGRGKDFVLIEGTGHAGVGSVFDMSNADVAKLLDSRVIIVSKGGIGRPIDEILLNKAVFDQKGVEVLGVIVNKVNPQKYDKIKELVRKGLGRHGIQVFGVIPLVDMLSKPSVAELVEDLDAEPLSGDDNMMTNTIQKFVIGDMQPHAAVEVFTDGALLIIPGNRDGLIVTALIGDLLESSGKRNVAAMVFTEGIRPPYRIMDLVRRSGIPTMLVKEDSFSIATRINNSIFKLRKEEVEKIKTSQQLVEEYVDVDGICSLL